MVFSSLMRDTVDVLKKDGTTAKGLKASVQGARIFMAADNLVIQPGDLILRHMSNGGQETFEIVDPCFYEGQGGIPANYQMRVRRLDALQAASATQNITYNVNGPNARINQNSVDNSTNVIAGDPEVAGLLDALRIEVESLRLEPAEHAAALEIVDAVKAQVDSQKPSRPVLAALLAALPAVASVTSIAASIVAIVAAH